MQNLMSPFSNIVTSLDLNHKEFINFLSSSNLLFIKRCQKMKGFDVYYLEAQA